MLLMRSTSVYLHLLLKLLDLLLLHLLHLLLLLHLLELLLLELLLHGAGHPGHHHGIGRLAAGHGTHGRRRHGPPVVQRRRRATLSRTLRIPLQIGQQVLPNRDFLVVALQEFVFSGQLESVLVDVLFHDHLGLQSREEEALLEEESLHLAR